MQKFLKHKERIIIFTSLVLFVIFWSVLLYFFSPRELVTLIGIENSYIIIFLVALFGGLSSFTTAGSFTPMLVILSLGGANPLLLGLVGGIALTIGDSFYYYLGRQGRVVVAKKYLKKVETFIQDKYRRNEYLGLFFIFVYIGLSPFPNDLITIPSGTGKIPYRKFLVALFLGNVTFAILIAEFAYILRPYVF